jgi:hypothetical protein
LRTVFLASMYVLCSFIGQAQDFAGGSGTEADPWIIKTPEQLDNLWYYDLWEYQDKHFKLGNDIDISTCTYETCGAEGWGYIGLTGTLDGDGHKVTGLWINSPYGGGLFSRNEGTIKNITVTTDDRRGGIKCGGGSSDGGLVSRNEGVIINCHVIASINGGDDCGGLVGFNFGGSITSCHSTCTVAGGSYCGGLVGFNLGGSIDNCYATGAVTASGTSDYGSNCGGLVGYSVFGSITNCYATGAVTAPSSFINICGGLIGDNEGCDITDCYATGAVTASSGNGIFCGGLAGRSTDAGNITNCYAAASKITATASASSGIGGLVGYNDATLQNCYYLKTGNVSSGVGRGSDQENVTVILSDADMRKGSSFPGFFSAGSLWTIDEGRTYPYLRGVGDYYPGVANDPMPEADGGPAVTAVMAADGTLTVNTLQAEQVVVYSSGGAPVYRERKAAGAVTFRLNRLPQGVYIVHGSSGWTRKVFLQSSNH